MDLILDNSKTSAFAFCEAIYSFLERHGEFVYAATVVFFSYLLYNIPLIYEALSSDEKFNTVHTMLEDETHRVQILYEKMTSQLSQIKKMQDVLFYILEAKLEKRNGLVKKFDAKIKINQEHLLIYGKLMSEYHPFIETCQYELDHDQEIIDKLKGEIGYIQKHIDALLDEESVNEGGEVSKENLSETVKEEAGNDSEAEDDDYNYNGDESINLNVDKED